MTQNKSRKYLPPVSTKSYSQTKNDIPKFENTSNNPSIGNPSIGAGLQSNASTAMQPSSAMHRQGPNSNGLSAFDSRDIQVSSAQSMKIITGIRRRGRQLSKGAAANGFSTNGSAAMGSAAMGSSAMGSAA